MKSLLLIFLILFCSFSHTQDFSSTKLWELNDSLISCWDIDDLGNLYLISNNVIQKYSSKKELVFQQSIKSLGSIKSIDASNPMKIALFSEDQQVIAFLDNSLTLQSEKLDLSLFDCNYVTQFCSSNQSNKYWIYDQGNFKIQQIASSSLSQINSENLKQILNYTDIHKIIDKGGYIYLIDYKTGVYKLNYFLSLVSFIPLSNFESITVEEDNIFILQKNNIYLYDIYSNALKLVFSSMNDCITFKKSRDYIYIQSKNKLYKLSLEK